SGAKPGDAIWHSGALGLSQLGFHQLQAGSEDITAAAREAHVRPVPQLALGQWLSREELASACMDLSDSLSQCLLQLADASGVGMQLDLQNYEFSAELRQFAQQRRSMTKPAGNGNGAASFGIPG